MNDRQQTVGSDPVYLPWVIPIIGEIGGVFYHDGCMKRGSRNAKLLRVGIRVH